VGEKAALGFGEDGFAFGEFGGFEAGDFLLEGLDAEVVAGADFVDFFSLRGGEADLAEVDGDSADGFFGGVVLGGDQ
jgi:hypothetical protein